jgi:hypothetical protein
MVSVMAGLGRRVEAGLNQELQIVQTCLTRAKSRRRSLEGEGGSNLA